MYLHHSFDHIKAILTWKGGGPSCYAALAKSLLSTIPHLQEAFSGSGIAPKWYQFGLKLNLTSSELHSVERKCRGKPLFQFLSEMLRIWLEKSPIWSAMVRALRGIEENELADKIKDEYGECGCGIYRVITRISEVICDQCVWLGVGLPFDWWVGGAPGQFKTST